MPKDKSNVQRIVQESSDAISKLFPKPKTEEELSAWAAQQESALQERCTQQERAFQERVKRR